MANNKNIILFINLPPLDTRDPSYIGFVGTSSIEKQLVCHSCIDLNQLKSIQVLE